MSSIKLKRLPGKERVVRMTFTAEESLATELSLYCAYYERVYGETVKEPALIPNVLKSFLAEDRGFQKYRAELAAPTPNSAGA